MTASQAWHVGVIVPAHNEEQTIARCIRSVKLAHSALKQSHPLWIVIVADSCCDSTVYAANSELGGDGEVLECTVGSAGSARTLGAAAVLARFSSVALQNIWLSNTDADSHVPLDWLERHLEFANGGDTGVAGVVELEIDGPDSAVQSHFQRTYKHAVDGTHSHVHGANLGVRADAYLAVGGWSALALAEDHCLWNRLKLAGWRLRSTIHSRVTTSARLHGRAPGGFAATLLAHMATSDV